MALTQDQQVQMLLLEQGKVEAHDLVYRHGITRAAACIHRLREQGWVINTVQGEKLSDGRRPMAVYVLVRPPEGINRGYVQPTLFG